MELSEYDYPPIALCSTTWLDEDKALSLGLSIDGIKYSIGYIYSYFNSTEQGKRNFLETYSLRNFTSLLQYYESISIDLKTIYSETEFRNTQNAVFLSHNTSIFLGKFLLTYHMCHVYSLKPATLASWFTHTYLRAKFANQSKPKVTKSSAPGRWLFSTAEILNVHFAPLKFIHIEPFTLNGMLITAKRFLALSSADAPCVEFPKSEDYNMFSCLASCYNKIHQAKFDCKFFRLSTTFEADHPHSYCHHDDSNLQLNNLTFDEFRKTSASYEVNEQILKACRQTCPRKCDRIIYESTLHSTIKYHDFESANAIQIYFTLNAMLEGGIWFSKQVDTYSFVQMVNNVGGALGLFIGGTIMTVAQLILFFIDYFLQKRKNK